MVILLPRKKQINIKNLTAGDTVTVSGSADDKRIYVNNTGIHRNSPDNKTKTAGVQFNYADNTIAGKVQFKQEASGMVTTELVARDQSGSTSDLLSIGVGYTVKDGTVSPYTYAPSPSSDSNDNNIANTSWVRAYCATISPDTSSLVNLSGVQTITGFKTFQSAGGLAFGIKASTITSTEPENP